MRTCGICDASLKDDANLCTSCADALRKPPGFCAEQLLSTALTPTEAALVDCWGRVHALEEMTPIGRRPVARGTAILEASVSRNHAEISRDGEGNWILCDRGSRNGTKVDGVPVTVPTALGAPCKIAFGSVELYFLPNTDGLVPSRVVASTATVRAEDTMPAVEDEATSPEETTFAGFPKIETQMFRSSAGGAGLLDMNGTRVQLTGSQFELVELLVQQMRTDSGLPIEVRGFVPSATLVSNVTWDSPYPTDNHLKQLIRRVRKMLEGAELGNLIESRRGFGYRLRCVPVETSP